MAACHAETTISLEMDSELEESEILQCTPPSIVIQLHSNKCSFFMFSMQKVSCVARSTQCTISLIHRKCFYENQKFNFPAKIYEMRKNVKGENYLFQKDL